MARTYRKLTAEEILALKSFAAYAGRTWKSELAIAWMNGANTTWHLQTIRNDFGPTWLVNMSLKDLPDPPMLTLVDLKSEAIRLADIIAKEINERVPSQVPEMPYAKQYVLEEVVKELAGRI